MASLLSPFPRFVFAVFEPISLIGGLISILMDPASFISSQTLYPAPLAHPSSTTVALHLGNMYNAVALVGLAVLYTTTERAVVRNYLVAQVFADTGHLLATGYGMGWDKFADVAVWNGMAVANIGVTTFLLVTRIATLLGVFGSVGGGKAVKRA